MYRLRWSRRLSESKYLVHWSLCQKSKLELKTDVEAEHGSKARQSWFCSCGIGSVHEMPGCKQLLKLAGCYRGSVGLFSYTVWTVL